MAGLLLQFPRVLAAAARLATNLATWDSGWPRLAWLAAHLATWLAGADVNAQDDMGFTALMHTAMNGLKEISVVLLNNGK